MATSVMLTETTARVEPSHRSRDRELTGPGEPGATFPLSRTVIASNAIAGYQACPRRLAGKNPDTGDQSC
jgi:hypothetical protein